MQQDEFIYYILKLFDELNVEIDGIIYNRVCQICRRRENVTTEQLDDLRDLLVKKEYLNYVSKRVTAVVRWLSIL